MATIETTFDATILPAWAQKIPAVVRLAERDLAFRCDLFRCTTPQYRRLLIREASRFEDFCATCGRLRSEHSVSGCGKFEAA